MKQIVCSIMVVIFLPAMAYGQMASCNVFLQGHYVEVGISPSGALGSTVPPPDGYHANTTQTLYDICDSTYVHNISSLGTVADPDMDGWDVGTDAAYYGDFFVPGFPQEGWAMQAGGIIMTAYFPEWADSLTTGYTTDTFYSSTVSSVISGNNISYADSAGYLVATWQGLWQTDFDTVQITQVTILDTEALFYNMHVTFTNLSANPTSDIFYSRQIDPDNDAQEAGGLHTTDNSIVDTSLYPIIVTTGTVYPNAFFAFGSTDVTAHGFFMNSGLVDYTDSLSDLWNLTPTDVNYFGTSTSDVGIGIVFNVGSIPGKVTGGISTAQKGTTSTIYSSRTISFFYAFKENAINPAIAATPTTSVNTVATVQANINAYPNPFACQLRVSGLEDGDQVGLFDITGRQISITGKVQPASVSTFTVADIPPGIYIMNVADKQGLARKRIKLQKL